MCFFFSHSQHLLQSKTINRFTIQNHKNRSISQNDRCGADSSSLFRADKELITDDELTAVRVFIAATGSSSCFCCYCCCWIFFSLLLIDTCSVSMYFDACSMVFFLFVSVCSHNTLRPKPLELVPCVVMRS